MATAKAAQRREMSKLNRGDRSEKKWKKRKLKSQFQYGREFSCFHRIILLGHRGTYFRHLQRMVGFDLHRRFQWNLFPPSLFKDLNP